MVVSCAAPESSSPQIYDNCSKLFLDSFVHILYNIHIMKKQKFNINKWRRQVAKQRKFKKECVVFMLKHPITWFILMITIAYSIEAFK